MRATNEYPCKLSLLYSKMLGIALMNLQDGQTALLDYNDTVAHIGHQSHDDADDYLLITWHWLAKKGLITWQWRTPDDPMDAAFYFTMNDGEAFDELVQQIEEQYGEEQKRLHIVDISYDPLTGKGQADGKDFSIKGENKKLFDKIFERANMEPLSRDEVLLCLDQQDIPHKSATIAISRAATRLRKATGLNIYTIILRDGAIGLRANTTETRRFFSIEKS